MLNPLHMRATRERVRTVQRDADKAFSLPTLMGGLRVDGNDLRRARCSGAFARPVARLTLQDVAIVSFSRTARGIRSGNRFCRGAGAQKSLGASRA